jgi:hypothetical protein
MEGRRAGCFSGGRAFSLSPSHQFSAAHLEIKGQKWPIPLRGNFVKETPKFLHIQPAVLSSNEFPDFRFILIPKCFQSIYSFATAVKRL